MLTVFVVGLIGVGVAVGMSDPGQIDIRGVVAERTQEIEDRRARGEDVSDMVVPRQDTGRPRPAIQPAAARRTPPTPVTETATTSATSTATSTATTTATGSEDEAVDEVETDDEAETEEDAVTGSATTTDEL